MSTKSRVKKLESDARLVGVWVGGEWRTSVEDALGAIGTILDNQKKANRKLQEQLQCSAKTQGLHKMVYKERTHVSPSVHPIPFTAYTFKCSICGLEISKTDEELSRVEKEALSKLKVR